MSTHWRSYTMAEVQQLAGTAPPLTDTSARVCPTCGKRDVRNYRHEYQGSSRAVSMLYMWCSNCHRYSSSTTPSLAGTYTYDDPGDESKELRELRRNDLHGLLDHLDALWDHGALPQRITPR